LIDENKIYSRHSSHCPEVFRGQWAEKHDAYLKSGRWQVTLAGNTVPVLLIPKPKKKPGEPPELCMVIDLHERSSNTRKLTSPLSNIEGMLQHVASKPFQLALDLKATYKQIQIVLEHVFRSAVTMPDGNMVSLVMQMGDCNALAIYQVLINHLFSSFIGRFMDVYLDNIIIYSDTLKEHLRHVRSILSILEREKLYLSKKKLFFLATELDVLGHKIDNPGIRMDLDKVNKLESAGKLRLTSWVLGFCGIFV
jgi:Reverse transcriptase (RNA-dependent DNA polymerase)